MSSGIEDTIRRSPAARRLRAAVAFLPIQSGRSELAIAATLTTVPFGGDTMTEIRLASVQGGGDCAWKGYLQS
jgi:hypothetical protein